MAWLSGKKTYIVALVTVAYGLVLIAQGQTDAGISLVLGGSGLGALRAGVSKS
jgi:hypothetical protein